MLLVGRGWNGEKRKHTFVGNVEARWSFAELLDVLDRLVVQLDLLEVFSNARRRHRLGDDHVAAEDGPSDNDLG